MNSIERYNYRILRVITLSSILALASSVVMAQNANEDSNSVAEKVIPIEEIIVTAEQSFFLLRA